MDLHEIIALDQQYYMNTFGSRTPAAFVSGEGAVLLDCEGRAFIDFLAGIAVNSLGYAHPRLTQAITEQAGRLLHTSSLFYIEAQARLAQLLAEHSSMDRVFFCNSGTEANEGAVKLARKYFYKQNMHKYEILSTINSFHGRTLAMVAATGQEKYQAPYHPLPDGFVNIPYNDLEAARAAVTQKTCAVLVEVIQGEGGIVEGTIEYIQGLRALCDEKGLLLIIDEVQTGIGRTGTLFGFEQYGILPDVITLAKGLGGGMPIGAILAWGAAASAFEPGDHGTTFGGNPLACAAGIAVLTTLYEENLMAGAARKGQAFKAELHALKDIYPFITDVRGKGLMLGLELDPEIPGKTIVAKAFEQGFIINCAARNTLRFVPPLVISLEQIGGLIDALDSIFKSIPWIPPAAP